MTKPATWQEQLSIDPLRLSPEHRRQMDAELGLETARRRRLDAIQRVHANTRITTRE